MIKRCSPLVRFAGKATQSLLRGSHAAERYLRGVEPGNMGSVVHGPLENAPAVCLLPWDLSSYKKK